MEALYCCYACQSYGAWLTTLFYGPTYINKVLKSKLEKSLGCDVECKLEQIF